MPSNKPAHWEDDKLGRWEQAQFLTQFMATEYDRLHRRSEQSRANNFEAKPRHFVMNIDSSWGFGKTFFLNRWQKDLEAESHLVLNFNAWENDYSKDPLLSFLSEIGAQLVQKLDERAAESTGASAQYNAHRWEDIKQKTSALLRTYGPSVARRAAMAAATTAVIGMPLYWNGSEDTLEETDGDSGSVDDRTPGVTEKSMQRALEAVANFESQNLFEEQNARKQAVEDFKSSLTSVVQSVDSHQNAANEHYKLPVFIFIDELDRCRPDFTIELIEVVKHIFSVDDVFFVFATDGNQLQASLEGMYGSRFDAETYFNRIFSREMHLKLPNNREFAQALVGEYGLLEDAGTLSSVIPTSASNQSDLEDFFLDFEWVADVFALTLRDQHQLAAAFDTILRMRIHTGNKTCTTITLALLVFWQKKKRLFKELMNSPSEFRSPDVWSTRLKEDFPLCDLERRQKVAVEIEDGWTYDFQFFTTLLARYSTLLAMDQRELRSVVDEGATFAFERHIAVDARNATNSRGQGARPLTKHFNEIMMAG